ncbi:hypothetical protein ACQEU6_08855 [Spirillospora sp. CA-108201]
MASAAREMQLDDRVNVLKADDLHLTAAASTVVVSPDLTDPHGADRSLGKAGAEPGQDPQARLFGARRVLASPEIFKRPGSIPNERKVASVHRAVPFEPSRTSR